MNSLKSVVVGVALLVCTLSATARDLLVGTASWCPYVCDKSVDKLAVDGYMVDLLQSIYREYGITIKIKIIPYAESIAAAERGEIDIVLGTIPGDALNLIYPRLSVGMGVEGFFTRTDTDWTYSGPESLDGMRLATVEGYTYEEMEEHFSRYKDTKWLHFASGDEASTFGNLSKLREGRVDVVLENKLVADFNLALYRWKGEIRHAGDTLAGSYKLWVAFSPKLQNLEKICTAFDRGLAAHRRSGKLRFILSKYGINDWAGLSEDTLLPGHFCSAVDNDA